MLTAKQHELIRFIQQRLEETGISPSFEEMKEALDLKSKSGVHRLISALEERGFLRRLPNRARALEVLKGPEDAVAGARAVRPANDAGLVGAPIGRAMPKAAPQAANDVIELPLHGRIAAGAPIEALEGQSTLPVPAALLGPSITTRWRFPAIRWWRPGSSMATMHWCAEPTTRAMARSWWRWSTTKKRRSNICGARTG